MTVSASALHPPVLGGTWHEIWEGPDQGLLASWLRGREKALETPDLADRAIAGELVILPWRGGVERAIKSDSKVGSLHYLAMWQGLRGDDLYVDPAEDVFLICTRTLVRVRFTANLIQSLRAVDPGWREESIDE